MRFCRVLACACVLSWPSLASAQGSAAPGQATPPDGIMRLVDAIAAATEAGNPDALSALATPDVPAAQLSEFVQSLTFPRATRSAVKERDRAPTETGRIRLLVETFTERDGEGRVSSWRMDVAPRQSVDGPWGICSVERLTVVSGLFRLAIDVTTEYEVHDLVITAPDLTLTLPSGTAFVSKTPDGPTALVLMGRGRMEFTPGPEAERGQVRIFSGADALNTDFTAAFLRLHPGVFEQTVAASALKPRAPDSGHLRRATQIFETYLPKSFQIDLSDLSTARWSLLPSQEDFVAEVVTSRFGPLTYARASAEAEDISFFDRRRHRNIAVYPSKERLESRGPFFSEDDRADYDITNYEIDSTFAPDRAWIDGTAKLSLRARSSFFSTLTLRLAEPLVVRSVTSPQFGRLLHLRIVGQNNVLIGFPGTIVSDTDFDLVITYGGRLPPQAVDREAITVQQPERREDVIIVPPETLYTYSNRSYWYPQAPVTDYATARISVTVPADLEAVASGASEGPPVPVPSPAGQRARKRFVFEARKPIRYLAVIISRFQFGPASRLTLGDDEEPITLTVAANPRQASKARGQSEKAADILKFYTSLLGDLPYDAFTLALTESDVPGGHSPAYFAMLNQPLPTSPFVWNNDPVSFQNYPSFFIAHEIAHQWWGQAVGWKNYHEQWISEGFAQYFAALYAERERGPEQFTGVLRQMRKWAIDLSPQGPVYLGYRLGHIRAEGRTFRALVYNKGAMVLHMLRRLVGDDAFFAGLRDFYMTWRYKKAGTDDLRVAMEKAAGRPLARFFERWIYGSGIPVVRFTSSVAGSELKVRIEQRGEVYDLPLTVSIAYADGTSEDVVVPIQDKVVERAIPLKGTFRSVEVNKDAGALVEVEKE
jgi:hypothetical protein